MGQLDGRVAIVTGGSAGIGLASARRFAAEGAQVYLTGRRRADLEAAAEVVGHGAFAVQADVACGDDMDRLYATVRNHGRRIDVILANAAASEYEPLEKITDEHFDKVVGINMRGPLYTVQKALPLLNEGASVVLVTSVSNTQGMAGLGMYAATKAAVRSFTRTWANELREQHIRVNALSPGQTETPAMDRALGGVEAKRQWEQGRVLDTPVGRLGTSEEQAAAALFLASGESSYISGVELVVDGGYTQI